MKKTTIEKIEKEIDEKTKLPDDIKDKIKKEIFTNIIVAVVIITYFIFIVLGSIGSIKNVRTTDINIFSMLFLGIAIVLFEVAYRKNKGSLAIYGIESLVVAIFTLFLPYIIFELDEAHKKYYLLSSIYIASYYILKSIYVSTRIKIKYMDSISDVKEIVKKEKSKRRIEESLEELKTTKEVKTKKNKTEINDIDIPKQKQDKENKEKKDMPKRRGRPKKSETAEKEKNTRKNNKKSELKTLNGDDDSNIDTQLKKRGRPRKVVNK